MRLLIATVLGLAFFLVGLPASAQAAEAYGPYRSEGARNYAEVSGESEASGNRVMATAVAGYTGDKTYCGLARLRVTNWSTKNQDIMYATTCDRMLNPGSDNWMPEVTSISMIDVGRVEVSACLVPVRRILTVKAATSCGAWEDIYVRTMRPWGPLRSGSVDDQFSTAEGTVQLENGQLSLTITMHSRVPENCVSVQIRTTNSRGVRTTQTGTCSDPRTDKHYENQVEAVSLRVCLFDGPSTSQLFRCGPWTKIA
ncbi:hypothetical protein ACIBG8_25435 [Nonomuraea sp. NPDC050556]|uniref:hypothetical protein n=1 Tax=Nonomuraea sp. NPDC050556 TaxID=3364369 RepID=UPI0037B1AF60